MQAAPVAPRRAGDHRPQPPLPEQGELHAEILPGGAAWLATGTFPFLIDASSVVRSFEARQGDKTGAPAEITWR